jgi:hypothetical protein
MSQVTKKHNYSASFGLICIWLAYTFSYFFLEANIVRAEYAGILYAISETVLNVAVLYFIISLLKTATKNAKLVLIFFTVSFSLVTLSDIIHIFLFNVLHISTPYFNETGIGLTVHHLLYSACLLCECAAWLSLVYYIFSSQVTGHKTRTYATLTLTLGVVLAFLVWIFGWNAHYAELSLGGRIFKLFVTSFYLVNFTLAILCLATSKKRSLFYLSLGYLIIMSADLIMKLAGSSQLYGIGTMDTFFILGLIFMLYGFWNFKKSGDHKLSPLNWVSEA